LCCRSFYRVTNITVIINFLLTFLLTHLFDGSIVRASRNTHTEIWCGVFFAVTPKLDVKTTWGVEI